MRLPGLVDPHVHMREPGALHKEDWSSGTAAALAGGFTLVLAMPNTLPPVVDEATLEGALAAARGKARCDYAQFLGAGEGNARTAPSLAPRTAGLKMYLDQTFGDLKLDRMDIWLEHLASWPSGAPVAIHAEGPTLGAAILACELTRRPVHLCHVSRRDEIDLIRRAKERGIPVTCEVAPHHLFLTAEDARRLPPGRREVRPPLRSPEDVRALWDALDAIDCFATDHAPHTAAEKDGPSPPPGFPGLESALPLLLTAACQGRLTLEDLVERLHHAPRRIFGLPEQPDTYLEIDPEAAWDLPAAPPWSKAGWSPFEGIPVRGRIRRVILRGEEVVRDGAVLAPPGSGRDVREQEVRS